MGRNLLAAVVVAFTFLTCRRRRHCSSGVYVVSAAVGFQHQQAISIFPAAKKHKLVAAADANHADAHADEKAPSSEKLHDAKAPATPPALRELKERTRYTGIMETVKSLAETFASQFEGSSGGRKVAKNVAKKPVGNKALIKMNEAGKQVVATKGVLKPATKQSSVQKKIGKQVSKQFASKPASTSSQTIIGKQATKLIAGERVAERIGEKAICKRAVVSSKALAGVETKAGKLVTGETMIAGERAGARLAKRGAAQTAARKSLFRKNARRAWKRLKLTRFTKQIGDTARSLAHHGSGVKLFEHAGGRGLVAGAAQKGRRAAALVQSARRIAARRLLGRGVLIALPVLGGVFALWAGQADYQRAKEEWEKWRRATLACMLFVGAALSDFMDTLCHFVMVHSLFLHGHEPVLFVESVSMACAVSSTFCAVFGELLSQTKSKVK